MMNIHSFMRRSPRWIAAALTLCIALPSPEALRAQDQKTVFVHGYGTADGAWQGVSDVLRN